MASQVKKPAKEPYRSPEFLVYGDILELTRTSANAQKKHDGGQGKGMDMTSTF